MRKIALVGFDKLLGKCFELVLKNILNESASICPVTEEKIRKDYTYDFIILHADKATPDSSVISLVRELRKNKCLSPIIAFIFSEKNIHKVFFEKAHKHFKYPIMVNSLKDTLGKIEQILIDEIGDFYKSYFCSKDFLITMLDLIPHDVKNRDWKRIDERIHYLEICHGSEIANALRSLLNGQVVDPSKWTNKINYARSILNEL